MLQSGQPYSVIDYSGAVGSIYYSVYDGITNPIVPLQGCTPKQAVTGASGAFGTPALKQSCFGPAYFSQTNPSLSAAVVPGDTFETGFTTGQRNIFRQAFQKRADMSLVKVTHFDERFALKYTFDVYNLTNTTSFDIPTDNVSLNAGYNNLPVQGQSAAPTSCASGNTGLFSCATGSQLGITTHTIGSPRQIQMSLGLTF